MNKKKLESILSNYISRFEYINSPPPGPDESYKWFAVKNFQDVFDIDAPDFASMLRKACYATKNLIDSWTQPFGGLVALAAEKGEAETIREMFRRLYADDGGNLNVRQRKITEFLSSCDTLLAKHYPTSFLYKNDQRSAMAYLWFRDPDNNYMCKNTEAYYFADAVEFYSEWGTYADFRTDVYYRFCDEIVGEIRKNPALLALHKSRFEGHEAEMHPDTQLHILVFDIIYCAHTYGLYDGVEVKNFSSEERKLNGMRREKAAELAERLSEAEKDMLLLDRGIAEVSSLIGSGAKIRHSSFGVGTLEDFDGSMLILRFETTGAVKKFELTSALGNGFLAFDTPDFPVFIETYGGVFKRSNAVRMQLKAAKEAFEPYAAFLD